MEGNKINVDQIQHIAIIMDGNRRWAKIREQPPMFGHQNGCETLLKIVKYAKRIGIKYMTVYAFSKENWGRTKQEVDFLMMLLKNYINQVLMKTREELENVQIKFTGNMEGVDEESKFVERLKPYLSIIKNPKQKGKNCYRVDINISKTEGFQSNHVRVYEIKSVEVSADEYVIPKTDRKKTFGFTIDILD